MTAAEVERFASMSNGNADDYTHFGDSGIPRIRKV
jgi:hypothetical protein